MPEIICAHEKCTGCAACFSVCPKECIRMLPDREGFLRPNIDQTQCIECGKCKKVCPVNREYQDDGKVYAAYAGVNKNMDVRMKSSSGGLFSVLAETVLQTGGAVVGAGFDEQFSVLHKVCTDINGLEELRQSKYVQSRIGTVFKDVKGLLDMGKNVLFCGTPCQLGGLKAFLGKDYHNLYTVDFICHGVPSPAVWKKYMEFREEKAQAEIADVSFRSKETGWKNYSLRLNFSDESVYSAKVSDDIYLRSFIMDMDLRPSCYQCHFKQIHRQSDITLADFWGIDRLDASLSDDTGVSLLIVHSEKGLMLLDAAKADLDVRSVPFNEAIVSNPSMSRSARKPALREQFMRDLHKLPFDQLHEKYCGTGITARIRRKLAEIIRK